MSLAWGGNHRTKGGRIRDRVLRRSHGHHPVRDSTGNDGLAGDADRGVTYHSTYCTIPSDATGVVFQNFSGIAAECRAGVDEALTHLRTAAADVVDRAGRNRRVLPRHRHRHGRPARRDVLMADPSGVLVPPSDDAIIPPDLAELVISGMGDAAQPDRLGAHHPVDVRGMGPPPHRGAQRSLGRLERRRTGRTRLPGARHVPRRGRHRAVRRDAQGPRRLGGQRGERVRLLHGRHARPPR